LLAVCCVASVFMAAVGPADAARRPPPPTLSSHGTEVRARYVDQCPRPPSGPREKRCRLVDDFRPTEPVAVHEAGVLAIETSRRPRRLRLALDCPQNETWRSGPTRWETVIVDGECTEGRLDLAYPRPNGRTLRIRYTFTLQHHRHCKPEESAVRAENGVVIVHSRWSPAEDPWYAENVFTVCRLETGAALDIGRNYCGDAYEGCQSLDHLLLADDKVAYVTAHYSGRYGPDRRSSLVVLDTVSWKPQRVISEQESHPALRRRFTDVVVKSNGSVAWVLDRVDYSATPPHQTQTYEVRRADSQGAALLDSSPDINPYSLTLSGSTLAWRRQGGETRSATLD
jgi:hypothetical protein